MILSTLLLSTSVLAWDPPPVFDLPQDLEICILKAEICAADAFQLQCKEFNDLAMEDCIEDYEDCSYAFAEAHEPNCRLSHVWCALELPWSIMAGLNPDFQEQCEIVDKLCPSY